MRTVVTLVVPLAIIACAAAPEIPEAPSPTAGVGDGAPFIHLVEPFDRDDFIDRFTKRGPNKHISVVASPDAARPGSVLRVEIPAGSHTGANFSWRFRDHPSGEPERLYSRYFIYIEPGWESGQGGKLPGPAGTYGKAGWGGRPARGTNGWSARMGFKEGWSRDSTQLTYYSYDLDGRSNYGRTIRWERPAGFLGLGTVGELEHGRWYCVESFIHLNAPDSRTGRLTGWVDGKVATDTKGMRFRSTPDLRIEEYWVNVYYGGGGTPKKPIVLYLDDLLLADTRLGCTAGQ